MTEAFSAPTPAAPQPTATAPADDDDAKLLPIVPCEVCGSLSTWWDIRGGRHCMACDGARLQHGIELAAVAARLRGEL